MKNDPRAIEEIAKQERARTAFAAECAKLGITDNMCRSDVAIRMQPPGEVHEQRKAFRRAINKISESIGVNAPTDDQMMALTYAGWMVSKCDNFFQLQEDAARMLRGSRSDANDWRDTTGRPAKVLRSAADFAERFAPRSADRRDLEEGIELDDFLRGVANMSTTPAVRAALSTGTDPSGGYTLPAVVMPEILQALVPASSLLSAGAGIIILEDEGAKSYTTAAVDTIPTASWRLENAAVGESEPTFRGVVAAPKSLAFLFKISRELLADSPNIQPALYTAIGQAFGKALDLAGLTGSGTNPEPRGIRNTPGIQAVTNGANGTALAGYANFLSAVQKIKEANGPMPTAAIMSPRSLVKLGGLVDSTGQPLRPPPMLEGMQFLSTSQVPNNLTVGTSTDCSEIYFGDFSKFIFAMRERMSVQILNERYADTGQVGFMCHVRADTVLQYPTTFALATGVRP